MAQRDRRRTWSDRACGLRLLVDLDARGREHEDLEVLRHGERNALRQVELAHERQRDEVKLVYQ